METITMQSSETFPLNTASCHPLAVVCWQMFTRRLSRGGVGMGDGGKAQIDSICQFPWYKALPQPHGQFKASTGCCWMQRWGEMPEWTLRATLVPFPKNSRGCSDKISLKWLMKLHLFHDHWGVLTQERAYKPFCNMIGMARLAALNLEGSNNRKNRAQREIAWGIKASL